MGSGYEITFTEKERKKVEEFANAVVKTDVYGIRNGQHNKDRRREQHIGSKLAELAVFSFIKSLGLSCSEPDFEVYSRNKKSWAPDMKLDNGEFIHVKSQDLKSADKYGISWIGEKSDKELYINNKGFVALCLVDLELNKAHILGFLTASFLKRNGLFTEPKLKKHREKKFAIYYKDVLECDKEQLWSLKQC